MQRKRKSLDNSINTAKSCVPLIIDLLIRSNTSIKRINPVGNTMLRSRTSINAFVGTIKHSIPFYWNTPRPGMRSSPNQLNEYSFSFLVWRSLECKLDWLMKTNFLSTMVVPRKAWRRKCSVKLIVGMTDAMKSIYDRRRRACTRLSCLRREKKGARLGSNHGLLLFFREIIIKVICSLLLLLVNWICAPIDLPISLLLWHSPLESNIDVFSEG